MFVRLGPGWRVCTKYSPSFDPFSGIQTPNKRCSSKWTSSIFCHTVQNPGIGLQSKRRGSSLVKVAIGLGFVLSCSFVLHRLSNSSKETPTTQNIISDLRSASDQTLGLEVTATTDYPGPADMLRPTLPGRPGNLTAVQEARLQDMWLATLKVFGVSTHDGPDSNSSADGAGTANGNLTPPMPSAQRPRTDTIGSNKKNKRRVSLFRRKQRTDAHDEEDVGLQGGDMTHGTDGLSTSEVDDKYGQRKDFAHALASQSPENLRQAFWAMVKHDHPDGLLLRFLRARKWDVEKALVMLIATMHWRMEEMHVDDDIIQKGEGGAVEDAKSADTAIKKEANDFRDQLRMGKSFLHGTDKEGRPMCFVRVRLHRQGEQSEASLERYTVYVIETARMLLAPPIDTAAVIFDMSNFSMANMDYGPVKFMIKCFEANYPESLGVVLVHKSPWVFQGIWNIIKGWLDPVVAGKVHFTKNVEELEHFVPRSQILKELGGDDDWTYEYVEPASGENVRISDDATKSRLLGERRNTVKAFEKATLEWLSPKQAMEDRRLLQERRDVIAASLTDGYWRLDPYIRARTIYDRTGVIKEGGRLDFHGNNTRTAKADAGSSYLPGTFSPEPRADDVD